MSRQFNGLADRITYTSLDLNDGNPFTISYWLKITKDTQGSATQNTIIWMQSGNSLNSGGIYHYGAGPHVVTGFFNSWSTSEINNEWFNSSEIKLYYDDSRWTNVVITSDGSADYTQYKCYHNGVELQTIGYNAGNGSGTRNAGTGKFCIGCSLAETERAPNGQVAEVAVWRRVLSESEIAALANGTQVKRVSGALEFYAPLKEGTQDLCGRPATISGSIQVPPHPPIDGYNPRFALADVTEPNRVIQGARPWTKQPPPGTKIDWGNPISRGLVRAIIPDPGLFAYNAAKQTIMQQDGVSFDNVQFIPTPYGLGRLGDNATTQKNNDYSADDPIENYLSKELSLMSILRLESVASNVVLSGESGDAAGHSVAFTPVPVPDRWRVQLQTNFTAAQVTTPASEETAPVAGGYYILVTSFSRTTQIVDLTIRRLDTGATGEYQATGQDIADDFVGLNFCNWGCHDSAINLGYAAWNRALSQIERESLIANPWQIFEQQKIQVPHYEEVIEFDQTDDNRRFSFRRSRT